MARPARAASRAMLTWNINTVRLPLNEHCWLGINGSLVERRRIQPSVVDYVARLNQRNLYVVLDLHWSAPGSTVIIGGSGGNQLVTMAFADHAIDFWTSVATTFKDDPMVIFDLFNEPILNAGDRIGNARSAGQHRLGVLEKRLYRRPGAGRPGMQQMLNAVRATGAQQVVVAGGIEWAHNLDMLAAVQAGRSDRQSDGGVPRLPAGPVGLRHRSCWNRVAGRGGAERPGADGRDGRARLRARLHRPVHELGRRARRSATSAGRGIRRPATRSRR